MERAVIDTKDELAGERTGLLQRIRRLAAAAIERVFPEDLSWQTTVDIPASMSVGRAIKKYYGSDQYRLWKRLQNPKPISIIGSPEGSPVSAERAKDLTPSEVI